MEKVSVKVCLGTTCFVMGGGNLQELNEIIPKKYGDKVAVNDISFTVEEGEIVGFLRVHGTSDADCHTEIQNCLHMPCEIGKAQT